jgi:hypothetical protein
MVVLLRGGQQITVATLCLWLPATRRLWAAAFRPRDLLQILGQRGQRQLRRSSHAGGGRKRPRHRLLFRIRLLDT